MMNKKGNAMGILLVIGGALLLLVVAFIFVFGISTLEIVTDTITPELTGLGQVGDWNASSTMNMIMTPTNSIVSKLSWLGGIVYIIGLMGLLGLAFLYRTSNEKWVIFFFFGLMMVLILCSIFISNAYEAFYIGTDDIALGLQSQALLSYMILYSPGILTIIGFIAGAIMFGGAGVSND